MASLDNGSPVTQSVLVVRHVEHSIQISNYVTDSVVEEVSEILE